MACNCNDNNLERVFTGTVLKLFLSPTATGFDAFQDNWEVEVRYGLGNVLATYAKSDMIEGDGGHIAVIDTTGANGIMWAIVRAYVPDADCPGGIRTEVISIDLCNIVNR